MRLINTATVLFATAFQLGRVAGEDRPDYKIEIFTDRSCDSSTGVWTSGKEVECENLDNYSVDIKSMLASGDKMGRACGQGVQAFKEIDCKGDGTVLGGCTWPFDDDEDSKFLSYKVIFTPC